MANAKFIDAATWASLPEIDVTNGEDLFPQLAAGTYRPVLSGVDSAVIPALTAGAIVQATPTVGDTLTVSGSNATGSATFQWQRDTGGGQADISGATSATYDTTGQPEGDYRRGVSDGVQGPVYTAAVTLGAAATVPATMSAPTVTATSDTEISVDRAAAPSDGGSAILSYDLRYEVDGSGSWTTVTGITDPQSVTGLTASTLYNVQTRAVNAVGAGAWSASGSATTNAAGVSFTDTFSYPDETELHTLSDYNLIDVTTGTVVARGGVATTATNSGGDTLLYDGATVAPDQYCEVTIAAPGTPGTGYGDIGMLMVRATDMNNRVVLLINKGAIKELQKKVGGVNTDYLNINSALVTGDTVRLEVIGDDIVVKKNGTTIHTVTNDVDLSGTLATGQPGFGLNSITAGWTTGVTFDQFKCGNL